MQHVKTKAILPVIAISLMTVISAVSGLMVSLPSIARDTGATQTQLTWVVDAYTVVFSGFLLIAGALSDRYGRRAVLIVGLSIYVFANVIGLGLSDAPQLIALRAFTGFGAALIMPSTLSVITTSFTGEERSKAIGVWVGVAGGGAIIGLFGTAFLLRYFDWHSFFSLNIVLAIIALIGTFLVIPESKGEDHAKLDLLGGLLSIIGIGFMVYGIIEGPEQGWTSINTLGGLIVGVLALATFIWWELRNPNPLLDPRSFKNLGFTAGSLSITLQFLCQFGFIFVGLQYLQYVAGFSAWDAVLRLLPIPLFILPSSRIVGKLAATIPQKKLGSIGMALIATGLFIFTGLSTEFNVWHFWLGLGFFAVGMAFASVPATTAITASLPQSKQGVASAVNDVSRELGSAIGIAILGSALNNTYRSSISTDLAKLPKEFLSRIQDSIAFTQVDPNIIVQKFPAAKGLLSGWDHIVLTAKSAFTEGMHLSLTIAGWIAIVGALIIIMIAPNKVARPQD